MSTEPSSKPVFPITDEVRALVTKRGVDELLVEEEFAQKLARSDEHAASHQARPRPDRA